MHYRETFSYVGDMEVSGLPHPVIREYLACVRIVCAFIIWAGRGV